MAQCNSARFFMSFSFALFGKLAVKFAVRVAHHVMLTFNIYRHVS